MTEKLKVSIYRKGCISCGTCWNSCPEFFEQNPKDACSQVIEKYRIASNTLVKEKRPIIFRNWYEGLHIYVQCR